MTPYCLLINAKVSQPQNSGLQSSVRSCVISGLPMPVHLVHELYVSTAYTCIHVLLNEFILECPFLCWCFDIFQVSAPSSLSLWSAAIPTRWAANGWRIRSTRTSAYLLQWRESWNLWREYSASWRSSAWRQSRDLPRTIFQKNTVKDTTPYSSSSSHFRPWF